MEGLPIKDTMLSDMCPDVESAFCFPHKVIAQLTKIKTKKRK
jgi:hypothetical protein